MVSTKVRRPTYDLATVHALARDGAVVPATRRCRKDIQELELTADRRKQLLLALKAQDFSKVFDPCTTDFGDVVGDVYRLWFDEKSGARCRPDKGDCFYMKLAIHTTFQGEQVLLISLHLDSRP